MPKDVTEEPTDSLDLQVFRAIVAEAPKIMERVFGPLPAAGDNADGSERAHAWGNGVATTTEP